jgi:WD40 repeat protein/serine/threonine protein kinase
MPTTRQCAECGTPLPDEIPEGACPVCALRGALDVPEDAFQVAVTEKPGDRIGRYKLLEKIGEGGYGTVYMAEQAEPIRRRVALKVIKLGMDTKQVIARFEAERQALALMDHPNIAKVLDAGATDTGRPFFVMELVRGTRITDYCDQHSLSAKERLDLFIQVCHAIQHAHQKGIIHRDIKPSNILVTLLDGLPVPKVIDFGIAKATQQPLTDKTAFTAFQQFIGTPAYMSPEQAELSGSDIDTRSDIYALGVLLYELLTGKMPFDAKDLLAAGLDEMRRVIREQEPRKPSARLSTLAIADLSTIAKCRQAAPPALIHLVRGDLDWIVMKCLEKNRARRYETATSLAHDIGRHLNSEPVIACPPSRAYRFQKLLRRNKLVFAAGGAVTLSLAIGFLALTSLFLRERQHGRTQARLRQQAERATLQESAQRLDAEAAKTTAQTEAQRAESAVSEARMILAASDFAQANRLMEADDDPQAIAYLSRVLSADPENGAALARLTMLMTYHSWMKPTLSLKHARMVSSAQFSPDGKRLVTASWDNSARVWDALTGQPLTPPMQHYAPALSAQFSPDGLRVVTASGGDARVWAVQTGQPLTEPLKHGNEVLDAQFTRDGTRVVTVVRGGHAQVWDSQTGEPLTHLLEHDNIWRTAQFSPDGKRVVTASGDSVQVWDVQNSQPLTQPLKHQGWVNSAEFSPDGKRIVTASGDGTARVYEVQTGEPVTGPLKHADSVLSARFSPDGDRVVTASTDDTARVWDAQTGQPLTSPLKHRGPVLLARFSADGKRVLTASADHYARVWDAETGQPLTEPLTHPERVVFAQFSPDGQRVLTVSEDSVARVWDAQTSPPLAQALKHGDSVPCVQFSPDGQRIVTASYDNTARVWDVQTGQPLTEPFIHHGAVYSAQFSPEGKRIVTASQDGTARVWDAQTGQPLTPPLKHRAGVLLARFSPDGNRVVTASTDSTARVWDAQTGQPLTEPMKEVGSVRFAEFSPDGTRVVTSPMGGFATLWDAQTGQPVAKFSSGYGGASVMDAPFAQFSPDGKRLVIGSGNNTARVYDAQTSKLLAASLRHGGSVTSAQFSPDSSRIVTASDDHTARVWDALTGLALTEPLKQQTRVKSAQFSGDGRRIITADGLFLGVGYAQGLAQLSPDCKRVVTASWAHAARVWDAQTGHPLTEPLQRGDAPPFNKCALVWDVGFAPSTCPDWLLQLAEALSGNRLNKQGLLEMTSLNRAQTIAQIRQNLNGQPDAADGVLWGRWLLGDRSTRTISPFSKVTVPEYIETRIKENTAASLAEAEMLAAGNTELSERVARARSTPEQTSRAVTLKKEAAALVSQGKLADAETKYREALEISRKVNGPEHPDTL